jgi:hypothetical protein
MASNINPYNIDGTFPVAGQDNSSQGFRDNFTNTKNNFIYSKNEISELQQKAIVTSALTGQTVSNDMAGTILGRPQLKAWTQTLLDLGTVDVVASLDFNSANFQKITTAGAVSVDFINWPVSTGTNALGYGLMRVWFNITDITHTVTLPNSVNIGVLDIAGAVTDSVSRTTIITFDAPGNYIFDFSSVDGGTNYLVFDVTRNRATLRDPNLYFNDSVTTAPTLFVGFGKNGGGATALDLALANDQGQSIVGGLGSYSSIAIGNLSTAGTTVATIDTGSVGGYNITAARGNLATSSIQPVHSNDYLGYFNAVAYSGFGGTSNVFQQTASIAFYATGSNVTYGLGGNIAFFTSRDGEVGQHSVNQALSINNDQTVQVIGTLRTDGGIVENGTWVTSFATAGSSVFTANTTVSTVIVDSLLSADITNGTIILPTNPVNGQKIRISTVANLTVANVWPGSSNPGTIKWLGNDHTATTVFATGNVSVQLTFVNNVWYRS